MDEIKRLLAYSNFGIVSEQLNQWNDKKPNPTIKSLLEMLLESELFFREMEEEFRISRQRNSEMETKVLILERELEEKTKTLEDWVNGL